MNFAFGDAETAAAGRAHLQRYYGFVLDYAALNVADLVSSPQDEAAQTVHAYRDLGSDGLLFHPPPPSLHQVDRLAHAVL